MHVIYVLITSLLMLVSISTHADTPAAPTFTLNTTAFLDQNALPVLYTCDGKDISPEFDWTNVPAKTQSLALIASDPDAPGGMFYHWVIYNIPKSVTTIAEGADKMPAGVSLGKNSWGKTQYNGPCPPKDSVHSYLFTLYALDSKLTVPADADGKTVLAAMQKHIVGKVALTAIYSRWIN